MSPERVDETIDYEIDDGEVRRLGRTPTADFDVIQHIELPDTPVHVTEYRLAVYQDADGNIYIPDCPELKGPIFGPRLLAMIGWLKSVGHCSYSTLEAWMEDVLQVPVSRGYLAKLCTGTISASLADAYGELTEAIPRQEQLGSDQTSIKDNGKRHWIWCITAATFSLFHISKTRSRQVLEKLVGAEFAGYLNFDYFSANFWKWFASLLARKRPRISLRGSQWWSISTRNLRRPASMISRRTTFVSCLPKGSNRRTITANSKSATA